MSDFLVAVFVNLSVLSMAAILSFLCTLLFIKVSHRLDFLDYPVGRKNHKKPMPFLGGASIFVSFWAVVFLGILICYLYEPEILGARSVPWIVPAVVYISPKLIGIFIGSLVILVVGMSDDKFAWSPLKKLLGQIIAAGILMSLGLTINLVTSLGVLGYAITFLWILLIMNAFNFIDSLDGHCAGIALISCIMFFWMSQIMSQPLLGLLLATFAGALMGFLPLNFKPAKIFLGDNGSLFIGYMLAAFTLLCKYQSPKTTYATLFIPILIFGVPIYDTMSVVVVRMSRGIAPWTGDRNHFAHRLVKIGMSDKVAVIFSYFIAFTIGHIAVLTTQVEAFGAILIGIIFLSIIGVIAFLEFYASESTRVIDRYADLKKKRKDISESSHS
jgi:UDP-GlcNAc:undecaprenyl-phosphate/decaprenyl-phosphate GlcNAc-1-phosphate transferase